LQPGWSTSPEWWSASPDYTVGNLKIGFEKGNYLVLSDHQPLKSLTGFLTGFDLFSKSPVVKIEGFYQRPLVLNLPQVTILQIPGSEKLT